MVIGKYVPEVREVVVVRELGADFDVLNRENPNPRFPRARVLPLLGFAVRVARRVNKPAQVPFVPRVDHLPPANLHQVKVVLANRLVRPQTRLRGFVVNDLAHVLDHEGTGGDFFGKKKVSPCRLDVLGDVWTNSHQLRDKTARL